MQSYVQGVKKKMQCIGLKPCTRIVLQMHLDISNMLTWQKFINTDKRVQNIKTSSFIDVDRQDLDSILML